ncbi:uncharacterized protein LOC131956151 [Physella acuta]|uniref:uncharacterized protein LOC131956151 n=1 Tax=Physella acuta TaxID=109671 RepID=UPI0027DD1D70|nr:uncharacterized protein LOC131956151 [Physella acuta]
MAVTNDRTPSSIKHFAWISRIRSSDGKVKCDSVADVQETQLVICELQDIQPTTKIVAEIQKTRDEHFFKLKNNSEFIYHTDLTSSFLLSTSNHRKYTAEIQLLLFVCNHHNSVPYTLVCDGYEDCYDGKDEEVCAKFSSSSRLSAHNQPCKTKIEFSPEHFFSDEQRCDGHLDCPEGDDEAGCDDVCLETLCDDGTCLPSQWFTNSSRACRFILPVNGVTNSSLNLTHSNNCSEFCDDGPCVYPKELAQGIVFCDDKYMDGNSCSNVLENKTWAARCILLKGRFNTKLGCLDLSHLDNCETFNCPEGLFKCPSSYCIPVYNLNDGYPDCPFGEDEDVQIVSENLFQCIAMDDSKSIYILPVHVCDNKTHCPRGDDELGCHVTCPAGFQCLAGTVNPVIHPDKIILTSLSELHTHTKFLNLSGVDLSRIRGPGIPGDFCFAPQDAFSSCEDLLGDQVKRILLWILAVVSVGGNLTVIGFRLLLERQLITKSYRLFITNLSISDLIMGLYLFIIAGNDVYYREDYVMYESEWRHSSLCTAAGFLATLSCETSALFVLLVTLERYLVIRFPLGPYRIKRVKKYFLLLVSWVVGVVLAVVPLVYPDWGVYSSNGMCLGLPMTRNQESGWAYSLGVFLICNCILFILIAVGQLAIFQVMSREKTQLHTGALSLAKRRREIMVAKNLSLVVMSNFLCWFPICVIGLMTARGHTFSQQTYGWLAVFVLPLNSAVNPVIYTLPVVYKKWEDFKNGKTKNNSCTEVTTT